MNQHALRHNFTEWVWRKSQATGKRPSEVVLDAAEQRGIPRNDYNALSLATLMDIWLDPLLSKRQEATVKDSNKERA